MRNGYWGVEALLGVALIVAPIVGGFTALHRASYPDVLLGAVIILWALVGYDRIQPAGHRVHHRSRF
ncbi:MAG TPA: hypothetical protein PKZ25_16310 [Candidatus Hydrogenedentes bacterium]|nr:hypothetical protein [Candidatus Hydrogenedentota bacterium]